ncbi:nuclear transport factor 2 family protein [Cesiribacter andamanensis]|uniref:Putative lumazine-binding protein n=1 Tax=Cesiribacter andamanensis AMV16 TaxID=1279009 RepID=M7NHX4_9BACT|nr:nuclear transport factor 2 family protein [Cesiribacter andamanensis]EMR01415.1 Putative lumazine-binding protein [Cesiribacter andamanensis AMV16]
MKNPLLFLGTLLFLMLQQLTGLAQQQASDELLIRETLTNYIEGRNGGDLERLKAAFHPSAALKFVQPNTNTLGEWSLEEYLQRLKPGQKLDCSGEITDIRLFNDAAQATVLLTYPDQHFHDYMSLLKVEGRWLIVDKTFARKPIQQGVAAQQSPVVRPRLTNTYAYPPMDAACEICTKQEYRDKSAPCPHSY